MRVINFKSLTHSFDQKSSIVEPCIFPIKKGTKGHLTFINLKIIKTNIFDQICFFLIFEFVNFQNSIFIVDIFVGKIKSK